MTVLILGGAGFIGKNLTRFLVEAGKDVVVFDRNEADYGCFIYEKSVKIVRGQLNDYTLIEKIFDENKIDIVIHLVATIIPETNLKGVLSEVDLNLKATMYLIDIMNKKNVNKLIYFSSGGTVYGRNGKELNCETDQTEPQNSYAWIKLTIEKYIKMLSYQSELKYLILRPSNPYGEYQNIRGRQGFINVSLGKIFDGNPIEIWGDGSVVRDYIYIKDLCTYVNKLIDLNKWNDTYNIGSGHGISLNDVIKEIKNIVKSDFEVLYEKSRNIDLQKNILSVDKIICDTGYHCSTAINSGIEMTWLWINKTYDKGTSL